jgi:hypothetical protein
MNKVGYFIKFNAEQILSNTLYIIQFLCVKYNLDFADHKK